MDIIAKARVYRAIIEKAMATADEQLIAKAPTLVKHWVVNEAVAGMKYYYNKYYIENNILYRCIREDAVDGVVDNTSLADIINEYWAKHPDK